MKKAINVFIFMGALFQHLGNGLNGVIPAYEEMKRKNALIDAENAEKEMIGNIAEVTNQEQKGGNNAL